MRHETRTAASKLDEMLAALEHKPAGDGTYETQKQFRARTGCSRTAMERLLDQGTAESRVEWGPCMVRERNGKPKPVTGFRFV